MVSGGTRKEKDGRGRPADGREGEEDARSARQLLLSRRFCGPRWGRRRRRLPSKDRLPRLHQLAVLRSRSLHEHPGTGSLSPPPTYLYFSRGSSFLDLGMLRDLLVCVRSFVEFIRILPPALFRCRFYLVASLGYLFFPFVWILTVSSLRRQLT